MRFTVVFLGSVMFGVGCGPSADIGTDDGGDETADDAMADATDGDDGTESGGITVGTGPEPADSDGGTTTDAENTSSGGDGSESGDGSSGDDEPMDDDLLELSECPEVTSESVYCLTAAGGGLEVVGVDTGTQCPLGPGFAQPFLTSLGWIGNDVYACVDPTGNGDDALARLDLTSGTLEMSEVSCRAAAALGEQILTLPFLPSGQVVTYDSFADATMGISESIDFSPQASRVTAGGGTIYAAWHTTDVLERYSVAEQTQLPDLVMGGYDSWVDGMSVVGDRLFIVTSSSTLLELDATTGDQVSESIAWPGHGLACRPGTG